MANPRQRKMARSSVRRSTQRVADKQKLVKMRRHPVMNKYWDNKLTMRQNYKRLGLALDLNGKDKTRDVHLETAEERRARVHAGDKKVGFSPEETDPEKIPLGEARLIRDAGGNVTEIIYGKMEAEPRDERRDEKTVDLIDEMIKYELEKPATLIELHPSDREDHWLQQLYEKHGDDYEAMKWDRELNQMLFSAGQLKLRMKRWKKHHEKSH